VVISANEVSQLREPLASRGYDVVNAGGAGYKILSVILGLSDLYVTSRPSTYKWDSCAGHAILVS
jgi:inositol polyphosphate 1-phosphatase